MTPHRNRLVRSAELPPPRNWLKRLRHYRRSLAWRSGFKAPQSLPHGRADTACPDFAIAAIAISRKYVDWCLTMISTVRRRGAYTGPIYIVTDRPEVFAAQDNVFTIPVPFSRVKLISKTLKPMIFEWLPQKFVAYIDADVIVIGSIAEWYRKSLARLEEVESPLLTYEVAVPVEGSFHGGLLFADRANALSFLRSWRRMLASGRYLSDQVALRRVATETVPAYYSGMDFHYLHEFMQLQNQNSTLFVHITNRMIQEFPAARMKGYLKQTLGVVRIPEHLEVGDGH